MGVDLLKIAVGRYEEIIPVWGKAVIVNWYRKYCSRVYYGKIIKAIG